MLGLVRCAQGVVFATLLAALTALTALTACKAKGVGDAEEKGDVDWLDANGSPEAVAALGRLADTNAKAVDALGGRASYDVNAYIAAWNATVRGAAWGPGTLRAGLADPSRAEEAATVMTRRDPHLAVFVPDLEAALVRLSGSSDTVALAAVLASAGKPAEAAIVRRLADGGSRRSMCRGIGSPDASDEARQMLMRVPSTSRDDESCIEEVLKLATDNDTALEWLATVAEPGLLSAAGNHDDFPCPRLKGVWSLALVGRPAAQSSMLTVPLLNAVKRCALALDPVLAEGLRRLPASHPLIVAAVDPYASETSDLKGTCDALRPVASGRDGPLVRERAREAVTNACRSFR
jgi:hypothetical protein